jgi:hypothetical protein
MKYRPSVWLCCLSKSNWQSAIIQIPQLTKCCFGQVNMLRPWRTTGTSVNYADKNAFVRCVANCVLDVSYLLFQTFW